MSRAKPQAYGEGSVYQRKSDGLWIGTLEAGWTAKGTRRRVTVSATTEAAARRKLRDKRRALERGDLTNVSTRQTVKGWAGEWLKHEERRLSPNAYAATLWAVSKWIVPTIGHRRLDALTPGDVRAVHEAQRDADLAVSTQVRCHSALMSLLKAALAEGYPVPSRVLVVMPPGGRKKKRRGPAGDRDAMTAADAVKVLEVAHTLPQASRWVAALMQGLRQGEALGLTWDEVDLDAEMLRVSWQLQTLRYRVPRDRSSGFRVPDDYEARQLAGAKHLVRPKSDAGWRVIPLVPWMRDALRVWGEVAPPSPHGLVWPDADGSPTDYKVDDEEWYALQCTAEVGHPAGRYYTIHEARHTAATLLMEAGVDPSIIRDILGHSSIVTSRGYMHASQSHARDALSRMADTLRLDSLGGSTKELG